VVSPAQDVVGTGNPGKRSVLGVFMFALLRGYGDSRSGSFSPNFSQLNNFFQQGNFIIPSFSSLFLQIISWKKKIF
jgi:hypothetical protein